MSVQTAGKMTEQQASDAVRCLAIPLVQGALLLPYTAVAEVTGYQTPSPVPNAPDWLAGMFHWRGLEIPLVVFEELVAAGAGSGEPAKLVVLNTLNGNPDLPFIALPAAGIPRLALAQPESLESLDSEPGEQPGVLMRVKMGGAEFIIPDFDALEQMLLRLGI